MCAGTYRAQDTVLRLQYPGLNKKRAPHLSCLLAKLSVERKALYSELLQ